MSEAQADRPVKAKVQVGDKLRGADKVRTIPLVNEVRPTRERKPDWIRVRVPANGEIQRIKSMLRKQKLHTVCEEGVFNMLAEDEERMGWLLDIVGDEAIEDDIALLVVRRP